MPGKVFAGAPKFAQSYADPEYNFKPEDFLIDSEVYAIEDFQVTSTRTEQRKLKADGYRGKMPYQYAALRDGVPFKTYVASAPDPLDHDAAVAVGAMETTKGVERYVPFKRFYQPFLEANDEAKRCAGDSIDDW